MGKRRAGSPLVTEKVSKKRKMAPAANNTDVASTLRSNQTNTPDTVALVGAQALMSFSVNKNAGLEINEIASSEDETVAAAVGGGLATADNEAVVPMLEKKTATTRPKKEFKKPPVAEVFVEEKLDIEYPPMNPFWGVKPIPGGPRPDPVQPSARESNGQTNPPLWEDRGYRYKRGSRYVKYFGPLPPDNVDELKENCDQKDLLVTKLMDMRPTSKKDPTPRRQPTAYQYGRAPPDWDNMQAIKALNDRRYQGIDRTTRDAPWTRIEREYLATLLREDPDASIWDLTERHNDRFMGKDFVQDTGFAFAYLSTGRTVESVRYEYTTYKPAYDYGEVPQGIRHRNDQSVEGRALFDSKIHEKVFGEPPAEPAKKRKAGAMDSAAEDAAKSGSKKRLYKKTKLSEAIIAPDSDDDSEPVTKVNHKLRAENDPEDDEPPTKVPHCDLTLETVTVTEEESRELGELAGWDYKDASESPQEGMPSPADPGVERVTNEIVGTPLDQAKEVASEENVEAEIVATEVAQKTGVAVVEQTEKSPVQETAVEDTAVEEAVIKQAVDMTVIQIEITTVDRCGSIHVTRKIEVDEEYDDEEEEL
jgi:hypothetical protein